MSDRFVSAFEHARAGISLPKIAKAMAARSRPRKNERGISANLYRLVKNNQTPKKQTVKEIADALGDLRKLSSKETQELQDRLLNAARPADSEFELKNRLRPSCEEALGRVADLSDHEIASILDGADVATMKLILAADKKGEGIVPMRLPVTDTVFPAGRAKIHVNGDLSTAQRKVLQTAAELIEAVLQV